MIGRLRGTLLWKQAPQLLLDVHGVGYEIEAPLTTFFKLPALGEEVALHTHLVVREDAHVLYGFLTEAERGMFRRLIRVTGVGARLAATILSGISAEALTRCVRDNDVASLTRLPGVGKKTAERLIMELRDRLDEIRPGEVSSLGAEIDAPAAANDPIKDAVSALVTLGYKHQDASAMVRRVQAQGVGCEEIIRRALQEVAK